MKKLLIVLPFLFLVGCASNPPRSKLTIPPLPPSLAKKFPESLPILTVDIKDTGDNKE
jgi:hypothetical protein